MATERYVTGAGVRGCPEAAMAICAFPATVCVFDAEAPTDFCAPRLPHIPEPDSGCFIGRPLT